MHGAAPIDSDVILDGRLALFHRTQRWLAVADLHYGYEVELCEAGGLVPLWGMRRIEERISELTGDYQPETLILLGDLLHGRRSARCWNAFRDWTATLPCEVVMIGGNHDRGKDLAPSARVDGYFFHHGHLELAPESPADVEIIGHWHPAIAMNDGAGLRLKYPAFIQETAADGRARWILPAFSPWSGGTPWKTRPGTAVRRWVCTPKRVFELPSGL